MWLANAITLARLPLTGLFWRTYGDRRWSLAILGVAALSDAVDGAVARWARARGGSTSTLGEWLDPAADKVFVFGALAAAVAHGDASWGDAALICAREALVLPLAAAYRLTSGRPPHAFQADRLGKVATAAQLVAAGAIFARLRGARVLAAAAGVLGVAAVAHYVVRARARAAVAA